MTLLSYQMSGLNDPAVAIYKTPAAQYNETLPFDPDTNYPEYPFAGSGRTGSENPAYRGVRESLRLLGLDNARFGISAWNPLGELIRPGETVLIKPNAVMHKNFKPGETVFAAITHGSVLRAVTDFVFKALDGQGKIIIADAPLAQSDFTAWRRVTGVDAIADLYKSAFGFEIEIADLRTLIAPWDPQYDFAPSDLRLPDKRDPAGYIEVDLGRLSAFADLADRELRQLYGADFNRAATVTHHTNGHHQYHVAKSVLLADTIISVPKLKVHSKVGVTLNLKGLVGTQGNKNYIPHFRVGRGGQGGDESPDQGVVQNSLNSYRLWLHTQILARENRAADRLYKILSRIHSTTQRAKWKLELSRSGNGYSGPIQSGGWYGNDTAWRMAIDLTQIVIYADAAGIIHDQPQRKFFSIIDGIIGGEDEGPLSPTAKESGVILSGHNPLAVDLIATRLMGFNFRKIPMLRNAVNRPWLKLWGGDVTAIPIYSNKPEYESIMANHADSFLTFRPPRGWRDHIASF
jgi:uncharacterized protein (DUF362 family)